MFLALATPSALAVTRKTTSATLEPRRARTRESVEGLTIHGRRIGFVYMAWKVGTQGLTKWIIVIGLVKRAHGECKGSTAAKGLTGTKGWAAAEEMGVADAKGPLSTSSGHTACGEGIPCLRTA